VIEANQLYRMKSIVGDTLEKSTKGLSQVLTGLQPSRNIPNHHDKKFRSMKGTIADSKQLINFAKMPPRLDDLEH
jgi:hypothetical protein